MTSDKTLQTLISYLDNPTPTVEEAVEAIGRPGRAAGRP